MRPRNRKKAPKFPSGLLFSNAPEPVSAFSQSMRIKRGLVGGWVCVTALFGAWVGCSPRTDIGVGPGGGSGANASPQAGGGMAPVGEGASPGGGVAGGPDTAGGAGEAASTSGGTDAGGSTSAGTDAGGSASAGTDAGGSTSAGTDAGGSTSAGTDAGGTAGAAGSAGSPPDLTIVRPTVGCGTAAPGDLVAQQFVQRTLETSGHKESSSAPAACRPGGQATYDWNITREYFVRLPSGYDPEKAYPLVLQSDGCDRFIGDLLPLPEIAEQVIQVGFSPAPGDCCFDILDGDQSIEFPFYEGVWQRLAGELCFDQNRVFAAGADQSTSIWANELGCVYSGHAEYPIRAIGAVEGGLLPLGFTQPTCSQSPMAGMWLHNAAQFEYQDSINAGIDTAMRVNGCPGRSQYTAERSPYEVPGLSAPESVFCGRITSAYECAEPVFGCPNPNPVSCSASHPMVMCSWGDDDLPPYPDVIGGANLAFAHFFSSFFAP